MLSVSVATSRPLIIERPLGGLRDAINREGDIPCRRSRARRGDDRRQYDRLAHWAEFVEVLTVVAVGVAGVVVGIVTGALIVKFTLFESLAANVRRRRRTR